jgi:DNA-binding NtrC family response regulator
VGGIRDRRIDVRILAATNRNLERQVQQNLFRGDLYFRLAVILLHLPPLRERGEDIGLLAEHFVRRFSNKYGKGTRRIDDRARQALMAYPWPGNVRELSHVIERAVLWSRNHILTVDDLSLAAPVQSSGGSDGAIAVPAQEAASSPVAEPAGSDLTQWERSLIERAMRESGGNQTKAAQRLGITRDTLRYRLKKFGLQGG